MVGTVVDSTVFDTHRIFFATIAFGLVVAVSITCVSMLWIVYLIRMQTTRDRAATTMSRLEICNFKHTIEMLWGIMKDEQVLALFWQFLIKELSIKSLLFLQALDSLKGNPDVVSEKARKLFREFALPNLNKKSIFHTESESIYSKRSKGTRFSSLCLTRLVGRFRDCSQRIVSGGMTSQEEDELP